MSQPYCRPSGIALALLCALVGFTGGAVAIRAQVPPGPPPPAGPLGQPAEKPSGPHFTGILFIDAVGGGFRDTIRLDRIVEETRRTPFQDVAVQVRSYGDAYYDSMIVPRAQGISRMANDRDLFDPLAIFLRELKAGPEPQRVFAWIDLLRVSTLNRPQAEPDNHVVRQHPNWLTRNSAFKTEDAEGNRHLEPALEDVVAHLELVVTELVHRYKVDGVIFDGLRYPGAEADWGYHPALIEAWRQTSGNVDPPAPADELWRQMRRENIDEALKRAARAARTANPKILVGVTALAIGPPPKTPEDFAASSVYQGAMQDWVGWMNAKMIDTVYLQNFRNEGEDAAGFDGWSHFAAEMVQRTGVEVTNVVAGFQNISIDVLGQMRRTQESGLAGVGLSNYREPIQDKGSREIFLRALGTSVFSIASRRMPFPEPILASATPLAWPPQPQPTPASGLAPVASAPVASPVAGGPNPNPFADLPLPPPPGEESAIAPDPVTGRVLPAGDRRNPHAGKIDEIIGAAPGRLGRNRLIEPSREAQDYLKRKFKNIF